MVNILQIITSVLILGAIGVSAWIMNMFFGLIGVGLLLALTVPMIVVMLYLADPGESGTGNYSSGRQSKGARQGREG